MAIDTAGFDEFPIRSQNQPKCSSIVSNHFMLTAITRSPSARLVNCEITFLDRQPIDYDLALKQHDDYCAVLARLGATVTRLSPDQRYPDSCFVEDTAIVVDELAVITSLGVRSRRGETATIAPELAKHRELSAIELPATIEGGDVMQIGKTLFVGVSTRTNSQGVAALTDILQPYGYRVCPVALNQVFHLKSGCTAIDAETILIASEGVDLEPFADFKLVFVDLEEAAAANTLRIGDTLLMQAGFPRTIDQVESLGYCVEAIDISEFAKAEAGLTCLSLIF